MTSNQTDNRYLGYKCEICGEKCGFAHTCNKPTCLEEQQKRWRLYREKHGEKDFPPRYKGALVSDNCEKEIMSWLQLPLAGLLTLMGPAGTGKTRMAYAVQKWLYVEKESVDVFEDGLQTQKDPSLFCKVPVLLKELQSWAHKDISEEEKYLKELYEYPGVLILDDLGAEKTTDFTLQDFYLLLAQREEWQLPTLITTNLTIQQIAESLGDRVASRIAGGVILEFSGKDRRLERK